MCITAAAKLIVCMWNGTGKTQKYRHYYITYLYEVLCLLKRKEKQKKIIHIQYFCQYFSRLQKNASSMRIAPGFIAPYIRIQYKYIIIKFLVCNSFLLLFYLYRVYVCLCLCVFAHCAHSSTCSAQFFLWYKYVNVIAIIRNCRHGCSDIHIPCKANERGERWMYWDRFTAVEM